MLNIILLGITSLLTDASTEMVYPLIPLYLSARLGASPAIIGLIEGIIESFTSLLKVFSGNFSDRLRRRKPLTIFGYSFSSLGKLILSVANAWGLVLIARIVERIGKEIRTAPRDALIADSTQVHQFGMAYGIHRAMDTIGAAIGVSFVILLLSMNHGNFNRVFIWAPALLGFFVLFFAKERLAPIKTTRKEFSFNWLVLPRRLKLFLIIVFLFALGNSSNQFLLLCAKNLGLSVITVLLVYLFITLFLVFLLFQLVNSRIVLAEKKFYSLGIWFMG